MPCAILVLILFVTQAEAAAQTIPQGFDQRGFIEASLTGFPQTTSSDSSQAIGQAILQWDLSSRAFSWLKLFGGIEAQTDTHHETERALHLDFQDRGLLRPAFEIRTARVTMHKGHFTADIGKQLVRWGKADLLNPTDRFAPRDYLDVVNSEVLGVVAARATVEEGGNSLDLVWTPWLTPSRIPLLNQRWAELPPGFSGSVEPGSIENAATNFPGGGQYGARLDHIGHRYEASVSFFEGYNHLPLIGVAFDLLEPALSVQRFYPKIRMYGTDAAIPLHWFTIKTEAGYFESRAGASAAPQSDDYILYVAQVERQMGDWMFVGGYVGQTIFTKRSQIDFDPERGLAEAFVLRVAYTIDARQSVSVEDATRQNAQGTLTHAEYSRLIGSHWRMTLGGILIEGASSDFLGQYRRNSSVILKIRYSF
ncbi:MAG TPA: hypothetical protein VGG72_15590 [Bryobacteraceae bacterium]|jgi:hypothetical protein